jgi:hypothetical protein
MNAGDRVHSPARHPAQLGNPDSLRLSAQGLGSNSVFGPSRVAPPGFPAGSLDRAEEVQPVGFRVVYQRLSAGVSAMPGYDVCTGPPRVGLRDLFLSEVRDARARIRGSKSALLRVPEFCGIATRHFVCKP